ncbi:MAG TPA: hypothetical protein VFK48_09680 [Usitatibacter sp.]|nr:hypothetical protein [Usitatibacter sp.]
MRAFAACIAACFAAASIPIGAAHAKTYALVSAIGSSLAYVKERAATGTHLEPYERTTLEVPDATLDAAAFRGLEQVVRQSDPEAKFVYLRLNPAELEGVSAPRKGEVALGKLATAFERMPQRKDWDQIMVITPRYVASERERLGSKLQGIGIFVRPFNQGFMDPFGNIASGAESATVSPSGEAGHASSFIAPYFYVRTFVLDAATLEVLYTSERFDYQRIHDPKSDAIDIERAVPPEKLGPMVEKFVETSTAKALREAVGEVTVGEPRVVRPH